jgi:hypothetical protein
MNVPDETQAYAEIVGEYPNQKLNLHLPRGDRGEKGDKGDKGDTGDTGASTTLTVLETTTGVDYQYPGPQGPIGPKGDPGGFVASTALAGENLDTIMAPGLYRQSTSTSATVPLNYPIGSSGLLEVMTASGATDVLQRYTAMGGGPSSSGRSWYTRRYLGGIWSTWVMHTQMRLDNTNGRAAYIWDDVNNREQMVYGDTGWRDVTPTSGTAAWIRLRRVGNVVYVWVANWVNGTASDIVALPLGFQTGTNSIVGHFGDRAGAPVAVNINGPSNSIQAAQSATAMSVYLTFPTVNSWPTTLPGTAHAAIPNA